MPTNRLLFHFLRPNSLKSNHFRLAMVLHSVCPKQLSTVNITFKWHGNDSVNRIIINFRSFIQWQRWLPSKKRERNDLETTKRMGTIDSQRQWWCDEGEKNSESYFIQIFWCVNNNNSHGQTKKGEKIKKEKENSRLLHLLSFFFFVILFKARQTRDWLSETNGCQAPGLWL